MELQQKHYFAMPEGLNENGHRAHEIIGAYLKEHGCTDAGPRIFYAPAEWMQKGNEYGSRSHLIVAYDGGGKLREVFSMDAAYALDCAHYQQTGESREPYALYEGMQAALREAGLYFEECTGWYSAIYSVNDASQEDA
jgi:hypothetical protein